jgi:hypothetical protein
LEAGALVRARSDQIAETCMVVPFDRAGTADGNVYAAVTLYPSTDPAMIRNVRFEVVPPDGA